MYIYFSYSILAVIFYGIQMGNSKRRPYLSRKQNKRRREINLGKSEHGLKKKRQIKKRYALKCEKQQVNHDSALIESKLIRMKMDRENQKPE